MKADGANAGRWLELAEAWTRLAAGWSSLAAWLGLLKALRTLWPQSLIGRAGFVLGLAVLGGGMLVFRPPPKLSVAVRAHDLAAAWLEDAFRWPLPRASGERFAIAVGHIEGDEDGSVEQALAESVRGIEGVELLRFDRMLRVARAASALTAETRAHARARRWLEKAQADLLVWGYLAPGRKVRIIQTLRNARTGEIVRLPVEQAVEFPMAAQKDFEAAVQAQVMGFLAQFDAGHAVALQLKPAIARLASLVEGRPKGELRTALTFALAEARTIAGEQAGDPLPLREAERALREIAAEHPRETAPETWAKAQHKLGNALVRLGELEGRVTDRFEAAAAAYRGALEVRTRDKAPLEWAATQNNLGAALTGWGGRGNQPARLKEALAAYREALNVRTPEQTPEEWAATQNNLGAVLVRLSDAGNDVEMLKEAVSAYRAALSVHTREAAPLVWAATQSNLANALRRLGEQVGDLATLREAVRLAQAATELPELASAPKRREQFQRNLDKAREALAAREHAEVRAD